MTRFEAYRILGIDDKADIKAIKTKYRQLMREVHPDGEAFRQRQVENANTAQEINEAYEYLSSHPSSLPRTEKKTSSSQKEKPASWKAPCNANAYCDRKVLHSVEDSDGVKVGEFCIAEGKYFWSPEEEFSLFLKSIYLCGKELLDNIDEEAGTCVPQEQRLVYHAELTYFLAVQFINSTLMLKCLAKVDQGGAYFLSAMLELPEDEGKNWAALQPGDILYPGRIRKHKLYLNDDMGRELGYLSFSDDRLYYVVIPLFEQRKVQVKMKLGEPEADRKKKYGRGGKQSHYRKVDMWMRFAENDTGHYPESIWMKIENLLKRYRQLLQEGE